jgi:hypothetical protein
MYKPVGQLNIKIMYNAQATQHQNHVQCPGVALGEQLDEGIGGTKATIVVIVLLLILALVGFLAFGGGGRK